MLKLKNSKPILISDAKKKTNQNFINITYYLLFLLTKGVIPAEYKSFSDNY